MKRIPILISCAFVVVSCGGAGAGVPQPATLFRANVAGDTWVYAVNINYGIFGDYNGSLSNVLTSDTYQGKPSVRDTQTFILLLNTGAATITSYSESSSQGDLLADMVSGVLYPVTSDTFVIGPTIGPSTADSGAITLSNGETLTESFKVVGAEWVSTRAGNFPCWVAQQQATNSDGTTDTFVLWMAPEIGTYVKITDTTEIAGVVQYSYTASLVSLVTAKSALSHGSWTPPRLPRLQIP